MPRRTRLWLAQLCGQRKFVSRSLGESLAGCCMGSYGGGCRPTAGLCGVTCSELRRTEQGGGEGGEHMCLADEDIPQRGRSRSKVEAAREQEALCSGRSLLFDHSRCYEGWCVSGRGFPARLKGFLSAELINRWHHKSRCSDESHDDLWIRCCETRFATEAAVAMFTLSTAS